MKTALPAVTRYTFILSLIADYLSGIRLYLIAARSAVLPNLYKIYYLFPLIYHVRLAIIGKILGDKISCNVDPEAVRVRHQSAKFSLFDIISL